MAGDFKKEKYEFKVGTKTRDFSTADPIFTRVGPVEPNSRGPKKCNCCEKDMPNVK